MRKIICIWGLILMCFLGCYYDDDYKCYSILKVNFVSKLDVDSVSFYLNDEQICFEDYITIDGICESCEKIKGIPYNYMVPQEIPIWKVFECRINEKQYGEKIDSSKLKIIIYPIKEKKQMIVEATVNVGEHYDIVDETELLKWHNYSLKEYNYNDSLEMCSDGFCVVPSTPLYPNEREACYEK